MWLLAQTTHVVVGVGTIAVIAAGSFGWLYKRVDAVDRSQRADHDTLIKMATDIEWIRDKLDDERG